MRTRLLVVTVGVLAVTMVVATRRPLPGWELDLTEWINGAPDRTADALWPVMQIVRAWAPLVVGLVAAAVWGLRRGFVVAASGVAAWFLAKLI